MILGAGVVALAVCAWMVPGPHQPSQRQAAATRASVAALARQQALPPAATGPSAYRKPRPTPRPAAGPAPTAGTAAAARSPELSRVTAPPASSAGAKSGACAPGDIVLSLFTSQPGYPSGADPRFSVYAVSTSPAGCTMTYGPGSVRVVVTSKGHVMWDSATCASPPAGEVGAPAGEVAFTLGVPQVVTLTWNPKAGKPAGCAGSLPAGAGTLDAATLDAVAISNGQSSPVRTFKLGG
jgi:hypothetical protein